MLGRLKEGNDIAIIDVTDLPEHDVYVEGISDKQSIINYKNHSQMKKTYLKVALVLTVVASLGLTSCIGSFSLTNKLLSWNNGVSNKFVNELIFFGFWILPVYEVTCLADLLVLNSIEFWSGSNPVAQGTKVIEGQDGRYLVECDGEGYTITSENDGSIVRLDFDETDRSWSVTADGQTVKLLTFVDDMHVKMLDTNGGYQLVELSEQGVFAYENMVSSSIFTAQR